MRSRACADGKQPDARLESHLWLLSALVQSSREAQTAALRCLPDLTQLLDTGATRMHPGNLRSKTRPLQHLQPVISARAWGHAEQCWLTTPMWCGMHTGPGECQWRRTSECWHAELGCCRAGHKPRCSRGRGAEQPGGPKRACADRSPECWRAGKASQVMESNPCCCPVHRHEAGSRGQACCGSQHSEVAKAAIIGLRRCCVKHCVPAEQVAASRSARHKGWHCQLPSAEWGWMVNFKAVRDHCSTSVAGLRYI